MMKNIKMENSLFNNLKEYSNKRRRNEAIFALTLISPAVILLFMVIFYPLVQALLLSFQKANLLSLDQSRFIGLENFKKLINDPVFWLSLKNTIIFVSCSVLGGLVIGTALALILNENIPFRNFFRGIVLIPWVVPGVVVGLLTLYMFNSQVGVINWVLDYIGITDGLMDWFGSEKYALWAIIISNIWNQVPFYMLMILAGLQTVPQDQYEAASIDGASAIKKFFYITLPNIKGVILIVTCLMVIWNFNNFDLVWTTTQGGPLNSTMLLSVYVYRNAFIGLDIGYAAAIGLIWLFLLLLFSTIYIRAMKGEEQ